MADWAVLARVTDVDNPLDPTVFKRGLELVDPAKLAKLTNRKKFSRLKM